MPVLAIICTIWAIGHVRWIKELEQARFWPILCASNCGFIDNRSRQLNLQALLFDVDGTLADTERDGHRVAFNQAFEEAGLDWHWDVALYGELLAVSGGKERMQHYMARYRPGFRPLADLAGFIASLHRAKTLHYTRLLADGRIPLRPGVARLLNEAYSQGMRMAITTTTAPANVEALLTHTLGATALNWFEVIAAGDIVPAKKPAADIYHYALRAMALNPDRCLAIEDSRNGLRASQTAGLKTVITVNEYSRKDDFSGAALVLDHMGEPDRRCTVLAGNGSVLGEKGYLDLVALRDLLNDAIAA